MNKPAIGRFPGAEINPDELVCANSQDFEMLNEFASTVGDVRIYFTRQTWEHLVVPAGEGYFSRGAYRVRLCKILIEFEKWFFDNEQRFKVHGANSFRVRIESHCSCGASETSGFVKILVTGYSPDKSAWVLSLPAGC